MKKLNRFFLSLLVAGLLFGCGAGNIISTPLENIDTSPLKVSALTDEEKNNWQHKDLLKDTIPGMSVNTTYDELIKNKKGSKVIVAVIDSGIDIDHEDLTGLIWTNKKEIPNNGIDDDGNGYVDDIHGWNFLGEAYNEQLEFVRILASNDTSNPRYADAQKEYEEERQKYMGYKAQYDQIATQVNSAHETLKAHFKKDNYTKEEVNAVKTDNETLMQAVGLAKYVYSLEMESMTAFIKELNDGLKQINERLNYNLNKDFSGRTTGDDINDITDTGYGDGNVKPKVKDESHGTHVAGIIAANRNNSLGIQGVANNVEIMAIRAVPNGDEYDKDIALAIRYAVDNGAKVINASFGKSYSPHSQWVMDALKYAGDNDVVFVHAAGNDGKDLDSNYNYPNDAVNNGPEITNTVITVGSLTSKYGSELVSGFSNYGKINVDIFAPGSAVYSTMPENEYKHQGGTSMASPGVAGIAALIRSYYPNLTAAQVKEVILQSGLKLNTKVVVGGDANDVRSFEELSKTGRIANAFNAFILAAQMAQ